MSIDTRTEQSHDEWETPEHILERVRRVFGGSIGLDPFTSPKNPTNAESYTSCSGYEWIWSELCNAQAFGVFANPPYGRGLMKFARKVVEESQANLIQIITLTPCRPDTKWYDVLVTEADAVAEVRGRLKFRGWSPKHGKVIDDVPAQFPSCLMYFGTRPDAFVEAFRDIARVRLWQG